MNESVGIVLLSLVAQSSFGQLSPAHARSDLAQELASMQLNYKYLTLLEQAEGDTASIRRIHGFIGTCNDVDWNK